MSLTMFKVKETSTFMFACVFEISPGLGRDL